MFSLKNKIALVTGGGSGIGAEICKVYARAGALVLVADIDEAAAKKTAQQINEVENQTAEFFPLDVSNEAGCNALADSILKKFGRLDVLVNNAGVGHVGNILKTTSTDLKRLFAVNVDGVFNLSKPFLPSMIEKNYGVIINMASIGGVVAVRDRFAYCASKFAVVGMTKSMALDFAHQGVRVNCICPGRVETPFVTGMLQQYADPQAAYQEMCSTQALGRMGTPMEVAHAAVYLASDEAAFITGTAFYLDGGWTAGK